MAYKKKLIKSKMISYLRDGGNIRTDMFNQGWISENLYNRGSIPIDLYYLWVNKVQINEADTNIVINGYLDNVTIKSQLESYIAQYKHLKESKYHTEITLEYLWEQIQILKALMSIKIENSN